MKLFLTLLSFYSFGAFAATLPIYKTLYCGVGNGADNVVSEGINAELSRVRRENPSYNFNMQVSTPVLTVLGSGDYVMCVTARLIQE